MNKIGLKLRALYLWACVIGVYSVGFIFVVIASAIHFFDKNTSKLRQNSHHVGTYTAIFIFKMMSPWWKLDFIDKHKLEVARNEPMVIICNHQSLTDIWALYNIKTQFRWLSKAVIFKYPIVGYTMKRAGYIALDRKDPRDRKAAFQKSVETIKRGECMLYFPEGTRSKTGTLLPFKAGAFKLAQECRVRILPVIINGAHQMMVKGEITPRAARVQIKILDPVDAPAERDLKEVIAGIRDNMQAELQSLVASH